MKQIHNIPQSAIFRLRLVIIGVLICRLISINAASASDDKTSHVLYINSYHRGYIWSDGIESGLRQILKDSGRKTELEIEFLDAKLFPAPAYYPTLAEVFAMKHGKLRYDAIIVSDNEAFDFAVRYRERLFPHTPIIFCGYNSFRPEVLKGITNVTGVNEEIDFTGTIDMALTVHPETRTLVFITSDYYKAGQRNQKIMENTLIPAYQKRYQIKQLKNLYLKELEQQLSALPPRTLVFVFGAPLDNRESQLIPAEEYYHRMAAASSAPAYSFWDFTLNTGMTGGNIITGPDQGRMVAELTLRVLDGTSADSIPVVMDSQTSKVFDFNAMKRFDISESSLPEGSIMINKPDTFYQRYKPYVWIMLVVFIILSAMVMLLTILLRKSRILSAKLRQHQEHLEESVSERTAELSYTNEILQEREVLFHGMFDKHSAVMLLIDPETGKIFLANQAALKYYGYTAEEFESLTIYQINQLDKEAIALEILNAGIEKRNCFNFLHRLASGEIRDVEVHSAPIPFKGKMLLFSVIHDITDRKLVQNALRESEERIRMIFENVPIGMFQSTPEGKFIYANPALSEILGYATPDELLTAVNRTSVADAIYESPERRPAFMEKMKHSLSKWNAVENRYRCKDGRIIDAILSFGERAAPMTGQRFLYGFIQDITDRKRTEKALKESEERFRLFMDHSPTPAWMKDEQGRCVYMNKTCEKVFGRQFEDYRGKTDADIYPPEIAEKLRENDLKVLQTNQTIEAVEQSVTPDGRVTYGWVFKFPFTDKHGSRFVCGIGLDITERKRAEEELVKAKEAAEAANYAKSAFLANMSHELRTPLNAILGYAQFLQKDPSVTEHQKERLAIIHKSGDHLLSLINDILDISKIEAGRIELSIIEFSLPDFLNNIAGMFQICAIQKGIEFHYKALTRLPKYVRGDEIRTRQILINILGNAIKFTEKGSVIFNAAYETPPPAPPRNGEGSSPPALSGKGDGGLGRIYFEIKDTGPGIRADESEKIFDPFHQTGSYLKKNEGTGLGLSISRKLTELMGGTLTVQSIPGQGAVFRVELELPAFGSYIPESQDASVITDETKIPMSPPCPQDLESLAISAKMGDVQAIRDKAEELMLKDKQLIPFAEELIQLAKEFQMSKIRTFLKLFRKEEQ
ncbi:MAG: hypothetical protein BWK80_33980 [Desulfobacteraceae bacterium IS3]|nr:MAG: hypothetical protein BWK80_33980 [Desulfobacteraceae bacterium IS3]